MPDTSIQQQIFDRINRSHKILLPLPERPHADSVSAALALASFLKKLDKEPHIVSGGPLDERYRFLPSSGTIDTRLAESRGFVISVRTAALPLSDVSYRVDDKSKKVEFFLKAEGGQYKPEDVTFRSDSFPYDLIITLDIPTLDLLGQLYESNTDLFFETPIINIDHHAANEHFGEINLVDITAAATTEILVELLEQFESGLIDADIATNLLCGILVETNSFQHIKTTPRVFMRASSLISIGANQQEIVRNLYKTKSMGLLKLWGRALARIRQAPEFQLSYSLLRKDDFIKAGTKDAEAVMRELISLLTDAKLIMLLAELEENHIIGYLQVHQNSPVVEIANLLQGEMYNGALIKFEFLDKNLTDAEAEVLRRLEKIKEKLVR